MAVLTEQRPSPTNPPEVVVRVDNRRNRRPSLVSVIALLLVAGVIVAGLAIAGGWLNLGNIFSSRTTDRSAPVILHRLKNLSSYHAAAATFSVTVDMEKDVSVLPGFLAGSRVIYSGDGTVDATVGMGALDAKHVTRIPDGTLVVTLPHARLGHAVLDLEHSHVMNRDRGLLDRIGGVFLDSPTSEQTVQNAAIQKMDRAARRSNLAAKAEKNTAAMVQHLAATVGAEKVKVRFA